MTIKFNTLLKNCLKSNYWPNQSGLNQFLITLDFSDTDLSDLKEFLSSSISTTSQKDIFMVFIDSQLSTYKKLFTCITPLYLFVIFCYLIVVSIPYWDFPQKLLLCFPILIFSLFATYVHSIFRRNKIYKLNILKYLTSELNFS